MTTGEIDLSISEQALIEMESLPTNPPTAATVMTSLFQFDLWGVRVTRWLAYLRAQTGSVAFMVVSY